MGIWSHNSDISNSSLFVSNVGRKTHRLYRPIKRTLHNPEHIQNKRMKGFFYKPEWNCMFIQVYKNATTSMVEWEFPSSLEKQLSLLFNVNHSSHFKNEELENSLKLLKDKNVIKFWIMRNPLSRIVSSYFYIKNNNLLEKHRKDVVSLKPDGWVDRGLGPDDPDLIWVPYMTPDQLKDNLGWVEEKDLIKSFIMFINSLVDNNFYDEHVYPQIASLYDKNLTIDDVETLLF